MVCHTAFFTIIGLFIHYGIWAWTFYISVAFVAVWKVQAKAYSICMISGAAFDFLIFEFALEFFISIIYSFLYLGLDFLYFSCICCCLGSTS